MKGGRKMKILEEKYTLSNGVEIPKLGLGTWMIPNNEAEQAVIEAVKIGYRHIDTAQAYQNEEGVGKGIKNCGLKREEIFVTTKLAAEIKSYEEAAKAIDGSLKKMDLDYVDMMIIHSPEPWADFRGEDHYFEGNKEAWKALEEAYEAGKIKAIGLSNFEKEDIENILKSCKIKPMVNQILAHISNTPKELIKYCKEKDILVEAYSPIAHGELMKNEEVKKIAEKYKVSIPQLSIRYDLQLGLLPLPKTANPEHMKNNAEVDFEISEEDMNVLENVEHIKDYGEASFFPVYSGKPFKMPKQEIEEGKIFPKGIKVEGPMKKVFAGDAWLSMLVTEPEFNCPVYNVTFAPKARNSWHSHPGGQILLVTSGEGYYQEKGKPARHLKVGDVVKIPANVKHWHGATADKEFVHIGITANPEKGDAQWFEPVSDEEYDNLEVA